MMKNSFILILLYSNLFSGWSVLTYDSKSLGLKWDGNLDENSVVGIPFGASVKLENLSFSRQVINPNTQLKNIGEGSQSVLKLGKTGTYRDLQIIPLQINSHFLEGNKVFKITNLNVTVKFIQTTNSSSMRKTFAGSSTSPAEKWLKSWLINYEQSRNFRFEKNQVKSLSKRAVKSHIPTIRAVLSTDREGIYVLFRIDLEGFGIPVGDLDPRNIRIYHREKEIPIYIHGENDGKWDSKDYLEFLGDKSKGTLLGNGSRSHNSFYSEKTKYYLTWTESGFGLRAPRSPVAGSQGGLIFNQTDTVNVAPPYKWFQHIEKDENIIRLGGIGIGDILDLGTSVAQRDLADFWFWEKQGIENDIVDIPFDLSNHASPEIGTGNKLFVTIRIQGVTDVLTAINDHHIRFLVNSKDISQIEGVENTALWGGAEPYIWKSGPLDPTILQQGENILTIQKINDLRTTTGGLVKHQDAYLDYIQLEFTADYKVSGDQLVFNNDFQNYSGIRKFILTNVSSDDFSLWDEQGRKLIGYNVENIGGTKQLAFTDQLVSKTRFFLSSLSSRYSPSMYIDTLENLKDVSNQADYLIITHPSLFGPALDSLVALRTEQGLNCRVIRASHIYDIFGEGEMDPRFIRDFIQYAYRFWTRPAPTYVLMLGETSVWFDKKSGARQKNLVPTNLIQIPGWGITSNDDYFTKVSGDDEIQDLWIGRIPVANQDDLSKVVYKIYQHEKIRKPGVWNNKLLLLGGYQNDFTLTNDKLQKISVSSGRNISRVDVELNSHYYQDPVSEPTVLKRLDSAFNIVSFVGHGGGAVWSDAGLLTLDEIDNGLINSQFAIPLVYSITCLTGFFEDIAARSLGEELLRIQNSGALSFYGASGYISSTAGRELSQELIRFATGKGPYTVGQIIQQAETMVALKTGNSFLPILGEFDLLGDPALQIPFPNVSDDLNLSTNNSSSNFDLTASLTNAIIESGEGRVSVYFGDSQVVNDSVEISGSSFSYNTSFDSQSLDKLMSDGGTVILHYWNDTESYISRGIFSGLAWMISNHSLSQSSPKLGDSVEFSFDLAKLSGTISLNGGIVLYHTGSENLNQFLPGNQSAIQLVSGNNFKSSQKIPLILQGELSHAPKLFIKVRMSISVDDGGNTINYPNIESDVIEFPIISPSDLTFLNPGVRVNFEDSLGFFVKFKNQGLGKDPSAEIVINHREGLNAFSDTIKISKEILPNQVDSLFVPISDNSHMNNFFNLEIHSVNQLESNTNNNFYDTLLQWNTLMISGESDTMYSEDSLLMVFGYSATSGRVYVSQKQNFINEEYLRPLQINGSDMSIYSVMMSSDLTTGIIVSFSDKLGNPDSLSNYYWHLKIGEIGWLKLDSIDVQDKKIISSLFQSGDLGFFKNLDDQPPNISFTSSGQHLLQDDFIPRHSPIDITIRDNVAVDFILHKPSVTSEMVSIDSTNLITKAVTGASKIGVFQFRPDPDNDKDSLTVTATDLSGNQISKSFVYKFGRGLSVHILGSYPNPFADSAVFVYQLTDFAENVSLKLYSRAGRLVRKFSDRAGSGYRELVWDGTSSKGVQVANGVYYLKITAKNSNKSSSNIFKVFRMRKK